MTDKILTELKAARALLENPKSWGKMSYAVDGQGNDVDATDPGAVCFCMLGALQRAAGNTDWTHSPATLFLGHYVPDTGFISTFNDDPDTTHEDVLAVFDKAIAAASDPSKRL